MTVWRGAANPWSHRIWRQMGRPHWEELSLKDSSQGNSPGERNWERTGKAGIGKEVGREVFSFYLCFWLPESIITDNRFSHLSLCQIGFAHGGNWKVIFPFVLNWEIISSWSLEEWAAGWELGPWPALTHQCHLLKRKRLIYIPQKGSKSQNIQQASPQAMKTGKRRTEGAEIQFRDEKMEEGPDECKVMACLVHLGELSSSSKPSVRQCQSIPSNSALIRKPISIAIVNKTWEEQKLNYCKNWGRG